MKTLLLLRHATASEAPSLPDHDRPLSARGAEEARQVGGWLSKESLLPDIILSSTARRAHETARVVAAESGTALQLERALYLAAPGEILQELRLLPPDTPAALVVGHNPGLEILLYELTGQEERLYPATLARVELPLARWVELTPATRGRLARLWRPGDTG